jgi:hypothetical protein
MKLLIHSLCFSVYFFKIVSIGPFWVDCFFDSKLSLYVLTWQNNQRKVLLKHN